jgi:hypothetical protein
LPTLKSVASQKIELSRMHKLSSTIIPKMMKSLLVATSSII